MVDLYVVFCRLLHATILVWANFYDLIVLSFIKLGVFINDRLFFNSESKNNLVNCVYKNIFNFLFHIL